MFISFVPHEKAVEFNEVVDASRVSQQEEYKTPFTVLEKQ